MTYTVVGLLCLACERMWQVATPGGTPPRPSADGYICTCEERAIVANRTVVNTPSRVR